MLLHLPPMEGHRTGPRAKNGPALAGHGAEAVRDAIAAAIITLPAQLRRSLTWDQGAEGSELSALIARKAALRVSSVRAKVFTVRFLSRNSASSRSNLSSARCWAT